MLEIDNPEKRARKKAGTKFKRQNITYTLPPPTTCTGEKDVIVCKKFFNASKCQNISKLPGFGHE